jgi:phage protein D
MSSPEALEMPSNSRCVVVVGGHRFDSFDPATIEERLSDVSVELSTNQSSEVELSVFDPKWKIQNAFASIVDGAAPEIKVYMGYGRLSQLGAPVFQGIATQLKIGDHETSFIGYDKGFKMKEKKNAEYFYQKDDRDIIGILASRNGLGFSPPPLVRGLEKYKVMMQDEKTDWQMAMERAREMGWILYVRGNTLYARYPARIEAAIATFINRKDFYLKHDYDFLFRIPEAQEGKKLVKRRGRGRGGARLEGKSDVSKKGKETVNLKKDTPGIHSKSKLDVRAQAQKDLEREHAFEGSIQALIKPNGVRIDVRDTVKVLEIGAVCSGAYICDRVRYEFRPGEMFQNLNLYRDVS